MLIIDEPIARIILLISRFLFLFVIHFWIYRSLANSGNSVICSKGFNEKHPSNGSSEILRVSEDFLFGVKIIWKSLNLFSFIIVSIHKVVVVRAAVRFMRFLALMNSSRAAEVFFVPWGIFLKEYVIFVFINDICYFLIYLVSSLRASVEFEIITVT